MLILRDTDGALLTLESARRGEWRRHAGGGTEADLRRMRRRFVHGRPFALGWSISLLPMGLFGVLPWATIVPTALFGYACQWSWGRTNWRIHERALPLVHGPAEDGEGSTGREILHRLGWCLSLLFAGAALAWLWPLSGEPVVVRRAWLFACGLLPAARHGWQLARLLRLRGRGAAIAARPIEGETLPC